EIDIHYYPASLVWSGAPSNFVLQAGDDISLITLDRTSLGVLDTTVPGVTFTVEGLIERPGTYQTEEIDEVLMNVHTDPYGRAFDVGSSGPDTLIVHRQASQKAPREHYYVPLVNPYADRTLLTARIRAGDRIQYARLDQLSELKN
ncbi:MAG: hypothetical protein MI861_15020, partial [Pirellulales bacterium]|nr:hypothetical protein [Pirellulales bacterium]